MGSKIARTNYAVAPGEFVAEWMEDNTISLSDMSERMGITEKSLIALLDGTADLTNTLAATLEKVTGIKARIWLSYETTYRADKVRLNV